MLEISEVLYADPQDYLGNLVYARRMANHCAAIELENLAGYARMNGEEMFAYLEISTSLSISDRAAQRRMEFAVTLTERLPRTLATFKQGRLEEFKAQLICEAVTVLTDDQAHAVETLVLERAAEQTPAQLRHALGKAVLRVDPEGAEQRRLERQRDRRVESRATDNGQAMLTLHHSADRIATIQTSITARARHLKSLGGEKRTLSQLEADVTADLLLGKDCGNRVVEVHLTVPATTAFGHDNQPGDIEGLPITGPAAREIMSEAKRWRWIRADPTTGAVADLTYPQYTPPAALATFIKVRDRTCRFQGVLYAPCAWVRHRPPHPVATRPHLRFQLRLAVSTAPSREA